MAKRKSRSQIGGARKRARVSSRRRRNAKKRGNSRTPLKGVKSKSMFPIRPMKYMGLLPPRIKLPLTYRMDKYYSPVNAPGPLTGFTLQQVYASGINDPDITGTGHQPYLHDQLATFYGQYRVWGFQITTTVQQPVGNDCYILWGYGTTTAAPYASADVELCAERPRVAMKWITADNTRGTEKQVRFSSKAIMRKQIRRFSTDPDKAWEEDAVANMNSNPAADAAIGFYIGYVAGPNGMTNDPEFKITSTIRYLVEFSQPKQFGAS